MKQKKKQGNIFQKVSETNRFKHWQEVVQREENESVKYQVEGKEVKRLT